MDHQLTERQYEILFLVAQGYRHHEIARQLYISTQTVKNHMTVILKRLNARSASHAVYLVFADPGAQAAAEIERL
ncbi:MAG: helix-turn-helix transcriptional regulator [Anaerolineae bacterium]|nr:helix-turn-helix transcriptional regulator [Anaerolineae bacterium]